MNDEEAAKLREYGLPNSQSPGTPTWESADKKLKCPNCGAQVCLVTVEVEMKMLRGGRGIATYTGCPACPWASPAVTRAVVSKK
jgi:hypothetical protein